MDLVRSVCEQRWPGVAAFVAGMAVFGFGLWANVRNGGDLQRLGQMVFLVGIARISNQSSTARLRTAYRSGRFDRRRRDPVLVQFPRHENTSR